MSSNSRLTLIDDLRRLDHHYLNSNDECYYLMEYTSRTGFGYSNANSMIANIKKPMDKKGTAGWGYKAKCIREAGGIFQEIIGDDLIEDFIWIPIPPSKAKTDPLYDDRVLQIIQVIGTGKNIDIREVFTTIETRTPFHESDHRPNIQELCDNLKLDNSLLAKDEEKPIILFDDMITAGTHFKACKQLLLDYLEKKNIQIAGIFVARRVFKPVEEEFSDDFLI